MKTSFSRLIALIFVTVSVSGAVACGEETKVVLNLLELLVQDHVSWLPRKYDGLKIVGATERPQRELPQLYEEEVVLRPGVGTATIDLKKPLWTPGRAKGLALDDIKAFRLCVRSPQPGSHDEFLRSRSRQVASDCRRTGKVRA